MNNREPCSKVGCVRRAVGIIRIVFYAADIDEPVCAILMNLPLCKQCQNAQPLDVLNVDGLSHMAAIAQKATGLAKIEIGRTRIVGVPYDDPELNEFRNLQRPTGPRVVH